MITLLGWIGSTLVVLSLAQRDLRRLRQVSLASALVLLAFNLAVGIASMVALNIALAAMNAYRLLGSRDVRDGGPPLDVQATGTRLRPLPVHEGVGHAQLQS